MSWVMLLAAAGALFTNGTAPLETHAAATLLSADGCQRCHAGVHAEWKASRHGQAWTNPIFQREYRQQPLDWCVHCHAPLAEQLADVRAGGMSGLAAEGVSCAVCHVRDDKILATSHRPPSPHDTTVSADFGGPAFCAGCHQFNFPVLETQVDGVRFTGYSRFPMQDTVAQHRRGPSADTPCRECHASSTFEHLYPGGHDLDMLNRALVLRVCRDGGALRLTVKNAGAGHNVPTGDVHRHLNLRVWRPSAPERLSETLFGMRFEPTRGGGKRLIADTSLSPGALRVVRVPVSTLGGAIDDPIRVELRLVYTIDEFPFRGKEVAEPTYTSIATAAIDWNHAQRCAE